ncbi:DUF4924 family protein [Reichenbachiella carrageenanivorans]|uniref:DUF4924 family protein n=1 Tax=Reichenbachiella carrageenanivorans TaxID=2979869 RepID=A0ABY6D4Y5_9BACT|nr:DUF4924 family protein [Reichenbachiella carrageenanivorans]UXX81202.1 DUF4924 family protein [Reichenbachiella carrageenanivorans]
MTEQTNNISEYIISIYRKEDLMRAYHFDLEKFGTQVINFFPISDKEKLAEVNHYEEFMQKMKDQGITEKGHLKEVNELVQTLSRLHDQLKIDDDDYFAIYQKALPFIENNMSHAKGAIRDEIQICINGIYGFLLLKIAERIIEPEEQTMVDRFGDLLSLLSYKYEEQKASN